MSNHHMNAAAAMSIREIHAGQGSAPVETEYLRKLRALYRSRNPKHVAAVKAANEALLRVKATPGSVHVDTALTNLSVQYKNEAYIGLNLMPHVSTGGKLSGIYFKHDRRSTLAFPDDELGARGSPNELNRTYSRETYSLKGYGYKEYVDNLVVQNQDAPLDDIADAIQHLNEAIAFRREKRIATVMTTTGNYAAGNTTTVAAGDAWNSGGTGDPIGVIQTAKAAIKNGAGSTKLVGFTTHNVMNVLSRHSSILELFKYGGTAPGLATPEMIGRFFGLDELHIAEAYQDTANEGQALVESRIWSDVFGIVRVAKNPSIRSLSFGYTFHDGAPFTDQWYDQSVGVKGGWYGRVSVLEDHKTVANDAAYLVVAPIL